MKRAQERGADLRLGASVAQIGQGRILLNDGREFSAQIIVNATGAGNPNSRRGTIADHEARKGHPGELRTLVSRLSAPPTLWNLAT